MIERISEPSLNVSIAYLLSKHGLKALGEVSINTTRRRQPDVIISINNFRIIIEGKKDPRKIEEAISQCEDKIDNGIADVCIAMIYKIRPEKKDLSHFIIDLQITQTNLEEILKTTLYDVVVISYIDRALFKGSLNNFMEDLNEAKKQYKKYENITFDELFRIIIQSYEFMSSSNLVDEIVSAINSKLELLKDLSRDKGLVERLARELELKR